MKIGILSDTHMKIKKSAAVVDHLLDKGAQFLIHAGDIGTRESLEQLKNSNQRYVAVYGNNDAHIVEYHNEYNLVQEPHYFKLDRVKFKLMHLPFYMNADADIIIFGHTHTFECDFKNGTLFLNPGEACGRNKSISECVLLETTHEYYNVTYYSKEENERDFNEQHFSFERV